MNKKGAVELSMTTIIIIVMGITILSLGLVWIRSVFTDVGELTSGSFEQGESQIAEIFGQSNEEVALSPSEVTMTQGEQETATLAIRNQESGVITVSATVEAIAFGGGTADGLICGFDDTGVGNTNEYTLSSGESLSRGLIAKDDGLAIGTYICSVTVTGLADGEKTTSLVVNVE